MSASFTPGPWVISGPWAGFGSIKTADGALIFGIARGDEDEAQSVSACAANASLIAAAPDYDAAAEEAIAAIEGVSGTIPEDRLDALMAAYGSLRRAQAKARGEQ